MSGRTRILIVALLLLVVPLAAMSRRARRKPQPKLPGPENIVWRFCQLDLQGARISERSSGSEELASLQLKASRKAAKLVVSDSCDVGAVTKGSTSARVAVSYSNLGTITPDGDLDAARRKESVTFVLKKVGNDWKISGPELPPHVSALALAAHWQHTANISKDAYEHDHALNVADALQRMNDDAQAPARRVDTSLKQDSDK